MPINIFNCSLKLKIFFFMLLTSLNLYGQDLSNTEWVKIRAERKDGSKIIGAMGTEQTSFKILFKEKTAFISTNEQYSLEQKYSVVNGVLKIGNFTEYQIDSVNDMLLIITEIPPEKLPDDRYNTYVFINSHLIFEYLNQTKQITVIGDTLIQCSKMISPIYENGDITKLFIPQFSGVNKSDFLTGTFIMSADGKINSVVIDQTKEYSKMEIEKFTDILNSTNGSWKIPEVPKKFQFKVDFSCKIILINSFSGTLFYFHTKNPDMNKGLSLDKISEVTNYFKNGVRHLQNEKYEKALSEFTKCIQIDSIYLDAYYNKAYAYSKLGDIKSACETWNKLKEMGQKQGENLYLENCK